MEEDCDCQFLSKCSCDASIEFMQCIADACHSGKCRCEGHHAFQSACNDMADLCPSAGLTCTVMENALEGKAMCYGTSGEETATLKVAPPKPKKVEEIKDEDEGIAVEGVPSVKPPEFFPVPTTTKCIVIICVQYMIIFTALAVVRTYHEFSNTASGNVEGALRAASTTMGYGPMLCVLFIACRMRVEFLSDGKDQPQMWVQNCMYATTFAVLTTTLVVLLLPLLTGQSAAMKKGTADLEKPKGGGTMAMGLTALRYVIQLGLYGGIAGVIVGIFTYLPPGEKDLMKLPPPAPAVMCTMILAVVFFTTQLFVALARSYSEFSGADTASLVKLVNAAADTVSFAPMLSILYLAARMRALQHDSQPQPWAQQCMYASTFSLITNTALAVIVPKCLGGKMVTDPTTGQQTFQVNSKILAIAMVAIKYLVLLDLYGGAFGVIASIFLFEAPAGMQTVPVSPTVQCVVNLCVQYFIIFLMLNIMHTCQELGFGIVVMKQAADKELMVTVIQAKGLKHMNFSGDNMRVVLTVPPTEDEEDAKAPAPCETKLVSRSLDPVWNETFHVTYPMGRSLHFAIQDKGLLGSRAEGNVVVPTEKFWPNGFTGEVPINGLPNATLTVSVVPHMEKAEGGLMTKVFTGLEASKATVGFAPMLSILFVTTRMYALLLTDKKGAPQAWVQDGMYMATWALLISFSSCILCSVCMDNVELDEDGNVRTKSANKWVGIGLTVLRYFSMVLLYGGIITVVVGIFVMTPETANGRGSIPVLSDTLDHTPMSGPPGR